MKIGFEAKRAYANSTGLGMYSRTLLDSLAEYYPENQYYLFHPGDNRVGWSAPEKAIRVKGPAHLPGALWRTYFQTGDIRKYKLDIFHGLSHELPLGIQKSGAKSVVTMHDLIPWRYPEQYKWLDRKIYEWKFAHACKEADVVVAISQQTKRDLMEFLKVPEEKIRVIYQASERTFESQWDQAASDIPKESFWKQKKYFLYVGTVNERKNLMGVVQALEIVRQRGGDARLVVVGEGGAYLEKVKAFLNEKNLMQWVDFKGRVSREELPEVYKRAVALVFPSLFEGFGIPIIESLSCGTPVITSRGGCFPEAAGPGALYVNPLDPQHIATAFWTMYAQPSLAPHLAKEGLQHVRQFSRANAARQWAELYQQLLK